MQKTIRAMITFHFRPYSLDGELSYTFGKGLMQSESKIERD